MKDQASLNLKIVDTPITKNALDGHLMLSATSTGLKLYDHTGVETPIGGEVDGSRLLPALDSVPVDRSGNPVVFRAVSEGMDEHTLLYCPFDADFNDHSAAGGQFTQTGRKSESITTDDKKFGAGGLSCGDNYNTYLSGPLAGPVGPADCTIHFWAKFNELNGRGPFALLTAAISKEVNFFDAAAGCIALSVYSNFIRLKKYTNGNGNASTILDASVALSTGVWHHFAVVRSGSTWHLFVDGELIGTGVNDTVVSSSFIRIGGDGEYTMNGLIDEFIVLDYAKWITDFEPPTQPATTLIKSYEVSDKGSGTVKSVNGQLPDESGNVTVETGSTVDESRLLPNVSGLTQADDGKVMQFKFTSAEAEIPVCCNCQALMSGTTDQLVNDSGTGTTLTLGNALAVSDAVPGPFGGNCVSGIGNDGDNYTISISPRVAFSAADDFTLEWWLRPSTNALNENFLYFCKENGNYDYSWRIYNGAFWQMSSEIIPASEISSLALKANDWNFLVLCRKSGMFRLFINGIRVFSKSWQWAPPESVTFWKFGGGISGTSNYCGGIRYSRSALYENDFEVPTAPFEVSVGKEMVLDFMREATSSKAGAMSAADKAKLDKFGESDGKLTYGGAEIGGGGISEIAVGTGLSGTGITSDPLNLNIANYTSQSTISLSSTEGNVNLAGHNSVNLQETFGNKLTLAERGIVITTASGADVLLNEHASNSPSGFVILDSTGKLPAVDGSQLTNLPAGAVDLSAYTGGISLNSTNDSAVTIKFNSGNPTYNAELSMSPAGVTLSGYGDVSLEHTGGSYLRLTSGEATLSSNASLALSAGSRLTISASEGIYLGAAGLNTAGGLVKVGDDGKIPSSLYDAGTGGDTSALETRVTTLETTVGTLNTTVDEILADYGEGSGALVYRVVASATEPENPTEGMLWIKTE